MRAGLLRTAVTTASLLLAGCDGNGPGGALTGEEEASLIAALRAPGLIAAAGPLTFGAVVAQADEIGAAGGQAAIGYQMELRFTGDLVAETIAIGLLGWTGLNTGTNTIASALMASVERPMSGFPGSVAEPIGPAADGTGVHYVRSSGSIYLADTGTFAMTSASFGDLAECPEVPDAIAGFAITSCRFATGTMAGTFDFEATRLTGTGAGTFTQPPTSYDVPAVRLALVIDVEGIAELRSGLGFPTAPAIRREGE